MPGEAPGYKHQTPLAVNEPDYLMPLSPPARPGVTTLRAPTVASVKGWPPRG